MSLTSKNRSSSDTDDFKSVQSSLSDYIRDPQHQPGPEHVNSERLQVYSDLFRRNIDGFFTFAFGTLKAFYSEADWRSLVMEFLRVHCSRTPYFREIPREFLNFVLYEHAPQKADPPFMLELVHYRWIWLTLESYAAEIPPASDPAMSVQTRQPVLSPLVCAAIYNFPVHKITPDFFPDSPASEPVYLVIWRNRKDRVRQIQSNALTARLLELAAATDQSASGEQMLLQIATEIGACEQQRDAVLKGGLSTLKQFCELDIICDTREL